MEKEYKLSVHFVNSKPIKIKNITAFFSAIENEYNTQLGKNLNLQFEDCETELAISEVKPGSQIFDIVAIVSSCVYPQYNEKILVDLFEYIKTILTDFLSENKDSIEKYDKKNCQNLENLTRIFNDDYQMSLDLEVYRKNTPIKKLNINNAQGLKLLTRVNERLNELEQQKTEKFENAHLVFFQTRNDQTTTTGDRVIINTISSKPQKVVFMNNDIKAKLLSSDKNIYKRLYSATGKVKFKGKEIKEYVITDMSIIRDGEYDNNK